MPIKMAPSFRRELRMEYCDENSFRLPEIAPYAKNGGLADVAKALPAALRRIVHGTDGR